MKLLPTQRDSLFEEIKKSGFPARDFKLHTDAPQRDRFDYFDVRYLPIADFHFKVTEIPSTPFSIRCSPGPVSYNTYGKAQHWSEVVDMFRLWLMDLARETSVVDRWAEVEKEAATVLPMTFETNDSFTKEEYASLEAKLNRLQASVQTLSLPAAQITVINDNIAKLLEQGRVMGKKDWLNILVGTMINTIVTLGLPPETSHDLWQLIKRAFEGVLMFSHQ